MIVFDDADLEATVEGIRVGGLFNGGQDCTAATRVICRQGIYDEFVAELAKASAATRTGYDPDDDDLFYGPINSANQLARISDLVNGTPDHARVVTGGKSVSAQGYFYEPTVIADLKQTDELITTEVFGPVMTVQRFTDEDDAVTDGQRHRVRSASSVWTANAGVAARISMRLDFGCVWVNCHIPLQAGCRTAASSTRGMARICRCTGWRTTPGSST